MSYLIHFNRNHDKNGRFTSGDGDNDGILDDHHNYSKNKQAQSSGGGGASSLDSAIGDQIDAAVRKYNGYDKVNRTSTKNSTNKNKKKRKGSSGSKKKTKKKSKSPTEFMSGKSSQPLPGDPQKYEAKELVDLTLNEKIDNLPSISEAETPSYSDILKEAILTFLSKKK